MITYYERVFAEQRGTIADTFRKAQILQAVFDLTFQLEKAAEAEHYNDYIVKQLNFCRWVEIADDWFIANLLHVSSITRSF